MENKRFSDKFFEIIFQSTKEKLSNDLMNFFHRTRSILVKLTHKYEAYISTMKNSIINKETQFAGLLRVGYSQIIYHNMMDTMQIKIISTEIVHELFKENEATLNRVKRNIEAEIRRVELLIQGCFTALKEENLRRITYLKRETTLYMNTQIAEFDSQKSDRSSRLFRDIEEHSKLDSSDLGNLKMLLKSPNTHLENVDLLTNFLTFFMNRWDQTVRSFGSTMVDVESQFFKTSRLVHANQFKKFKEHSCCNEAIRRYYGYLCAEKNNLMITIHRIISKNLEPEY